MRANNLARLRDLLALIHRDGGHHTEEVGLEQSYFDAVGQIVHLRTANEELEKTFQIIETNELKRGRPRRRE